MRSFDIYTCLNGMSAAIYFVVSLLCGLQLNCNLFGYRALSHTLLARLFGWIFLVWSASAVCNILCYLAGWEWAGTVSSLVDNVSFAAWAVVAYVLYANRLPSLRTLGLLLLPYVSFIVIGLACQIDSSYIFAASMLVLLLQYLYYWRAIRQHESSLEHIYSDPESHSLQWLRLAIALYGGWLVLQVVCNSSGYDPRTDVVSYLYMTAFILILTIRISHFHQPVSTETQQLIEQMSSDNGSAALPEPEEAEAHPLQKELLYLLEQEHIYQFHDLNIESVAQRLHTTPKFLSAIIHHDMQTSFSQLINSYRVELAKELLRTTDDKIEYISSLCGFNSPQSMLRSFVKITGQLPSKWREMSE